MAVGFITGRMGNNRTKTLLDLAVEEAKEYSDKPIFILVPEQYTHEMEKKLAQRLEYDKDRYFRIRILSFSTLSNLVFTSIGGLVDKRLKESTKNILMYKAMLNASDKLKTFKVGKNGVSLIQSMSKMIDEFKMNFIQNEDVKIASEKLEDKSMSMKLEDFYNIYSEYNNLMEGRFVDSVDSMELFSRNVEKLDIIDGASVYIDEFLSFTPVQWKVIESIILKASRVYFSILLDIKDINYDKGIFFESNQTYWDIVDFVNINNIGRLNDFHLDDFSMIKSNEVLHIESNISRYSPKKYGVKKAHDIRIISADSPYREIENIARKIKELISEGYRFRDISVSIRDLDGYRHIVENVFKEFDINYFLDSRVDSSMNQIFIFLMNIVDLKRKNYSYQSMFSYLKNSLLDFDIHEISVLENYVLANGIKGKKWFETWDKPVSYRLDDVHEINGEELSKDDKKYPLDFDIEKIRQKVIAPIEKFKNKTSGRCSVRTISTALYDFVMDIDLPSKIDSIIEILEEDNLMEAREYSQVWNIFVDMLDEMVEFLNDDYVSIDEFYHLLETEISSISIGIIPPKNDQILVTEPSRMRKSDIKISFVAGVNEDIFPRRISDDSMLTNMERKKLRDVGVRFYQNFIGRILREQLVVYKSLCSASEKLFVSYSSFDVDGKSINPSPIIPKLISMFGGGIIENSDNKHKYITKADLFDTLCEGILNEEQDPNYFKELAPVFVYLSNDDEYKKRVELIIDGVLRERKERIESDLAHKIYGKGIFSVSKLEKYAMCPYSYFVNYGLKAEKRREYSFVPLDSGIYTHKILDEFSKRLSQKHILWKDIDGEYIKSEVEDISKNIMNKNGKYILNTSERFRRISDRINSVLSSSLLVISEQIKRGELEPRAYECGFGVEKNSNIPAISYRLNDGTPISIVGKIDRIDTYFSGKDSVEYVRVVDYKSSNKELDLNRIYYGLQMQLFMYMNAIINYRKAMDKTNSSNDISKKYPAQLSYMEIKKPIVDLDKYSSENMELNRFEDELKSTKMKGYVIKDINIIKILDSTLDMDKNKKSSIMDVTLKKGGISSFTKGLEISDFRIVSKYVNKKAVDISEEIYSGNIAVSPYRYNKKGPCEYCDFKSICKFDENMGENKYRLLKKYSDAEVIKMMNKEVNNSGK